MGKGESGNGNLRNGKFGNTDSWYSSWLSGQGLPSKWPFKGNMLQGPIFFFSKQIFSSPFNSRGRFHRPLFHVDLFTSLHLTKISSINFISCTVIGATKHIYLTCWVPTRRVHPSYYSCDPCACRMGKPVLEISPNFPTAYLQSSWLQTMHPTTL